MIDLLKDLYNGIWFTLIVSAIAHGVAAYVSVIAYTKVVVPDLRELLDHIKSKFVVDFGH